MTIRSDIYYPACEMEKVFIKSIWRLSEHDVHNRTELILPKGTVEIIFNFSDPIHYINPSQQQSKKLSTVFINGINFKPFKLIKTGGQEFLGIQLSGAALKMLFNIPAKEFNNRVYEGLKVCPSLDALGYELFSKHLFSEQVETLLKWIRRKVYAMNQENSVSRVQKLMSMQFYPSLTVKNLSDKICLSDRQLRRFCSDWVGMSTEEFILYTKYLTSLHLLHNSKPSLTEVGLKAGYYDQSHFIREFKSYTDMTPKEYHRATKGIPGHIYGMQ